VVPGRARLAVGIVDLPFHQEVIDFLHRDHRIEVVAATADEDRFSAEVSRAEVAVVCPQMASRPRVAEAAGRLPVLLVAEELTVPVLREAIDIGAAGVFAWPGEREELAETIARVPRAGSTHDGDRGRVIAVYGTRGGAGTTFLATNLGAAFADLGRRTVVVDLDELFGDLTPALGIRPDQDVRTLSDLIPVADELTPDHVEEVLFRHPRGFSVLLGAAADTPPSHPRPRLVAGVVALLAVTHDVVILHVPRTMGSAAHGAMALADDVLLLSTLDVFSLHGARRALHQVGAADGTLPGERWRVVLNMVGRPTLTSRDAQRILGIRPDLTVRFDPRVGRVQDRGLLLPARPRRAIKDVRRLARLVLADPSATETPRGA
jgi:pilus assembly protein CpaE